MEIWPGRPSPLGATRVGSGTNFAVFSEMADRVELCLFDEDGTERRVDLPECEGFCWHGYLPDVQSGARYGYRMHGPWDPSSGQRMNPAKLLIDPYAKAIDGDVRWSDAPFDYDMGLERVSGQSSVDDAPDVPRSIVVDQSFDWGDDRPPGIPWHDTVIYEAHVKGLTMQHPDVPNELRGAYLGVSHQAIIDHLTSLHVTAIELLPVHHFVHDRRLVDAGLTNYWGYNSIGFLAPHQEYAVNGVGGNQVAEFKSMVRTLHASGIEVILDVVYNHTGEGDHTGPTLAFRGIDNAAYYRLDPTDKLRYIDYTGTGNSLNMQHPHVLQLIMDSLRYWVQEMHVDGFRFDLAAALARELHDVDRLSAFFDLIQQDPVVQNVKLIAEPWDVGEGGYQVGNFPPLWTEWNGKFRDIVRDHWRGVPDTVDEFATRVQGSSDLYRDNGRRPFASINFVTCHDGFTLRDLTSYASKHNDANGEDNRDGSDDNRSDNGGVEGPTTDLDIRERRSRRQRALLATLFCAQGVPMLLGGDELGRTQQGNNNAYCQDNEVSWLDWANIDHGLLEFTRTLGAWRASHPVLRRRRWLVGRNAATDGGLPDSAWFTSQGQELPASDWGDADSGLMMLYLNGDEITGLDDVGRVVRDDSLLIVFNRAQHDATFTLPDQQWGPSWIIEVDSSVGPNGPPRPDQEIRASSALSLAESSVMVLRSASRSPAHPAPVSPFEP